MQPPGAGPLRIRSVALALSIAGLAVAWQLSQRAERYDRFHLPAYDGHVYAAMAERPEVFTVAPWGYRLLAPLLAAALPLAHAVRGFAWLTPGALAIAAVLLFVWWRRLGHAEWAALVGVAIFATSEPVAEALRYEVLAEPVGAVVLAGFVLATVSGAGPGLLALLAVLGALAKEVLIVLLPLALLAQRRSAGVTWPRALREALVAGAPAAALAVLLRLVWTPHLAGAEFAGGLELLARVPGRLAQTLRAEGAGLLLYGVVPVALLGALREKSAAVRQLGVWVWLAALAAPLLNPGDFHTRDVRRLELYALPGLIALALVALDRLRPQLGPAFVPRASVAPVGDRVAAFAALVLLATPALLDDYRRVDLRGRTDAPLTLATCRVSLEWAERLARGEPVEIDLEARGPRDDEPELAQLGRLRWFLFAGFAPDAARASGPAALEAPRAALIVPLMTPASLDVRLRVEVRASAPIRVGVNGQVLLDARLEPAPETSLEVHLPGAALFRGDNLLELETPVGSLRLLGFVLVPSR